ncbi:MAG: protein kinase domain-containing protein [bacterium]
MTDKTKKSIQKTKTIDGTRTVSIDFNSPVYSSSKLTEIIDENIWKYKVESEIGRGGIGRVLIAFDEKIGRKIALKELIKKTDSNEGVILPIDKLKADEARFLHEAKVTGQLEHPGIVPVYEIGKKPDGNHYYTMRLVKGSTLSEAISEAGSLEKRLRLIPHFRDICNAVAYSHSRGVIHRDIKPENIMIGEFGETVVLDWGLAKVKGEVDSTEGELREELDTLKVKNLSKTVRGKAIGTPAYMSPEQAKGDISEIDERSDIYSLGAVLYEILTGHPPFRGRDVNETLNMVKTGVPVEITIFEPNAPPDLCAVVAKTLTKEKEARYQSAIEVAREMENFMSGGKIKAYEYSSWELFKRFSAKNKMLTGLIFILIATMILGSLMILHAYRESVKNERAAHLNLSLGYLEYAERLTKEKRYLSAKIFSAAALYHNPYNLKSPWSFPEFYINENIDEFSSQMAAMQSMLYLSTVHDNGSFKEDFAQVDFEPRVLAVSPDGALVAVAGKSRKIVVYSTPKRKPLYVLSGHSDEVSAIEFSSDGKYLASGSWDRKVKIWDTKEGALLKTVEGSVGEIYALSFSADSNSLVFGGTDKYLWSFDMTNLNSEAEKIMEFESSVRAISFSLDNDLILSDSWGNIYFLKQNKLKSTFKHHVEPVISLKFMKKEGYFVSTGYDKKILVWHLDSPEPLHIYEERDAFFDLDITSDGAFAAVASRDGTVKLINLNTMQVEDFRGHVGAVYSIAFNPSGNELISTGEDSFIKVWKTNVDRIVQVYRGHTTYIPSLKYSPDGRFIASSSWDNTVKLWDAAKEKQISSFGTQGVVSYSIDFSPDGQFLASGDSDGSIRMWNPVSGKLLSTVKSHSDQISALVFSEDGRYILSGSKDRTVNLYDRSKRKIVKILRHNNPVIAVAFSKKGEMAASVGRNGETNFWSIPDGNLIFSVQQGKTIVAIAFSNDGSTAVSAYEDGSILEWDMKSKKVSRVVHSNGGQVNGVAFSLDGSLLATVGKEVTLYNCKNFEKLLVFDLQYNSYSVDFERDALYFSVSDGAVIKRYPVILDMWKDDPVDMLKKAEEKAGKKLEGFKLFSTIDKASFTIEDAEL